MSVLPFESAAPGTARRGRLPLELGEHQLELPYAVLQGSRPGPRLLVTAGVHGCEYASIEAAVRLSRLDPGDLAGRLVVLPIVNTPAYAARRIYHNPLDGKNPNRVFPGDPAGSASERLAAWLVEVMRGADAYIDLHGGDMNESLTPFSIFSEGDLRAEELAEVFGIPFLVSSAPGGTTISAASRIGVPAVLAEAGGNGLWSEDDVMWLERGSRRVMQFLEMLPGRPEPLPTRRLGEFAWLRAEQDGLWYPAARSGQTVRKGQALGRITDPFGDTLQPVAAPLEGVVLFAVTSLAINAGDPLYGIGA